MKKIFLVFKTHFDIGFTDLSQNVIKQYAGSMLDDIIETCESTAHMDKLKFVWTMPSWPLRVMLDESTPEKKKKLEKLIRDGQVVWHALPFTSHTDFCTTEDMIQSLKYAKELSETYDKPLVKSAKMTDVPGHGRILPTVLSGAGVEFLHMGCNEYAMPPEVPTLFYWQAQDHSRVLTMYDPMGYGTGLTPPKDWDYPIWMAMMHTHDNCGPQSAESIIALAEEAKKMYPDAEIVSGTMDDFYNELSKYDLSCVPVVEKDLADTWIHGVGSFPRQVSQIREAQKMVSSASVLSVCGKHKKNFVREIDDIYDRIILFNEHTWGLDVKTWLTDRVYHKKDFLEQKKTAAAKYMEQSWNEQMERAQAAYSRADALWKSVRDDVASKNSEMSLSVSQNGSDVCVENHRYRLKFDSDTGKIYEVYDIVLDKVLLKSRDGESVFSYRYDIYGKQRLEKYLTDYCYVTSDWGILDNGRDNYPDIDDQNFHPKFTGWKQNNNTIIFSYETTASYEYGDAEKVSVSVELPQDGDEIFVELDIQNKQETPFIESGSFVIPLGEADPTYTVNKNGQNISPETDICKGSNHVLYCVDRYAAAGHGDVGVCVVPYDTPLMSIGETGIYTYRQEYEKHSPSLFFNLWNNMWGTNFPQWMGGNYKYKFALFGYRAGDNMHQKAYDLFGGEYNIDKNILPVKLPDGLEVTFMSKTEENVVNIHVRDILGTDRAGEISVKTDGDLLEKVNFVGEVESEKNSMLNLNIRPYSLFSFNLHTKSDY